MKTIETTISVLPDGSIRIPPRSDLTPGQHRAVLIVEEAPLPSVARKRLQLKLLDWSDWSTRSTYRREEIYGSDER